MKKLNELVKLAKRATSGEWNAFISAGGDGTFSIHTTDDSRKGNVVNWPGFDTANCSKAQKKANAKYIAAAHPDALLAIAEAFRALEQRAEAAEAKLAELEKQQPVGEAVNIGGAIMVEWERCISDGTQLFTRPAPAINLAELVPNAVGIHDMDPDSKDIEVVTAIAQCEGWNACRAAILRNIEETK